MGNNPRGAKAREQAIERFEIETREALAADLKQFIIPMTDAQLHAAFEDLERRCPTNDVDTRVQEGISGGYFTAADVSPHLRKALACFVPHQIVHTLQSQEPTLPRNNEGQHYLTQQLKRFHDLSQAHRMLVSAHDAWADESVETAIEKITTRLRAAALEVSSTRHRLSEAAEHNTAKWRRTQFRDRFVPMARTLYATGDWTHAQLAALILEGSFCPVAARNWGGPLLDSKALVDALRKNKV